MKPTDDLAAKRLKMIEHLEAALSLVDETGDGVADFMIDQRLAGVDQFGNDFV